MKLQPRDRVLFTACSVVAVLVASAGCAQAPGAAGDEGTAGSRSGGDLAPEVRALIEARFASSPEVQATQERIEAQLSSLPEHPWAGAYSLGDGLGRNLSLTLSPTAFTFRRTGCLGLYDDDHGTVRIVRGVLELAPHVEREENPSDPAPTALVPMRWGPRSYLIPPDQMHAFQIDVAQGLEPRDRAPGEYFLRSGDEALPVGGAPEIPEEYAREPSPIEARITRIASRSTVRELEAELLLTVAELDTGTKGGVFLNMEVQAVEPDYDWIHARVTTVSAESAEVLFRQFTSSENPLPEIGWQVRRVQKTP